MQESHLLEAFKGTNTKIPLWFMRQAGRYLPEYQALKKNHSLEAMFQTPSLAAEITCMPIDILGVDAAILFADILTLPIAMGFEIRFDNKKGPLINTEFQIEKIKEFNELPYLGETIALINKRLPSHVPLIGFAGSPFTVLTYLIEGGSSVQFTKTLKFIHTEQEMFHRLMKKITQNTISYLQFQKQAGIKAFQLFDSWAEILRPDDYAKWVLPYVQDIFQHIDLPSIYYVRNCHHLLAFMDQSGSDFLSVGHNVNIEDNQILLNSKKGIQGNLYNGLLYADEKQVEAEVNRILTAAQKYKRYIFNLSHGVFPDIKVETLKRIVKQVHDFR